MPDESASIERDGYAVIRGAFNARQLSPIRKEIEAVYGTNDGDGRAMWQDSDFRYEMFNRSPRAQKLVGRREILDVIEPLLGEDCHIIANTCWRNPANTEHVHGGGAGISTPARTSRAPKVSTGRARCPIRSSPSAAISSFRIARSSAARPV